VTPEEQAREQADQDLRAVLLTPAGRRFVWRVVESMTRSLDGSFAGEATHATAYNEGLRAVGLHITLETQRVAPELYVVMLQEALQEREDARRRREAMPQEPDEG